jgi:hypothetical protein
VANKIEDVNNANNLCDEYEEAVECMEEEEEESVDVVIGVKINEDELEEAIEGDCVTALECIELLNDR